MWGGREGGHGQGTGEALRNALRYSRQPERGRRSNGRGPIPACSVRVAEVEGQEEGDLTGDDRQVVASGQNELAPGPLRARKGWRRNTGSPPEPRRPEEPDVRSTSPVPWELGEGNLPWLPYPGLGGAIGGACRTLDCLPEFLSRVSEKAANPAGVFVNGELVATNAIGSRPMHRKGCRCVDNGEG